MATDTEAIVRRAYQVFDSHIGVAAMFAQLGVRPDFSFRSHADRPRVVGGRPP